MPFIDEEKLATLYKEIDHEKKASIFFQELHHQHRKKLQFFSVFRAGFFILVVILLVIVGLWGFDKLPSNPTAEEKQIALEKIIDQLRLENKILSEPSKNIQSNLRETTVYTVQFGAFKNKDIILFSDQFVNFRAYPKLDFYAYSLGNFATAEEAEAFRQELLQVGLLDVWVTSYQMDKRILFNSQ